MVGGLCISNNYSYTITHEHRLACIAIQYKETWLYVCAMCVYVLTVS